MIGGAVIKYIKSRLKLLSVLLAIASVSGFAGAWHWSLDLFSHFVAHYFAFALLLLGAHLWLKQYSWSALALVVAAGNGFLLSPYVLPANPTAPDDGQTVEIFQFNIKRDNPAPLAVLGYVLTLPRPPDVLVFLEATPEWSSELGVMKDLYPVVAKMPRGDNFGMAVLSRLPNTDILFRTAGAPPVPQMVITGRVGDKQVRVYALHPPPPLGAELTALRNAQLETLAADILIHERAHVVVAGDLNTTVWSSSLKGPMRRAGLRDGQRGLGYLPSWAPPPLSRWLGIPIDLTLVSDNVEVVSRRPGPWLGSDHWPVHTVLRLR